MKEVERKDLPGISGGQTGNTNVMIIPPAPDIPTLPQPGPIDPTDPFGDAKKRQVEV